MSRLGPRHQSMGRNRAQHRDEARSGPALSGDAMYPARHACLALALRRAPKALGTAVAAIRRAVNGGGLAIASITLWEVAMMIARGRVVAQWTPEAWLTELGRSQRREHQGVTPAVAALATPLAR